MSSTDNDNGVTINSTRVGGNKENGVTLNSTRLMINSSRVKNKSRNVSLLKKVFNSTSLVQHTRTQDGTINSEADNSKASPRGGRKLNISLHNLSQTIKINKAIDSHRKKQQRDSVIVKQAKQKEELLKEEKNEECDKVYEEAYEEYKERGFIRDFLRSRDHRIIKEGISSDKFYQKKENYINFKSDCLIFPYIRNHFIFSQKKRIDDRIALLTTPNTIDTNTQVYLNLLKRKCQKNKDERVFSIEKYNKKDLIDAKIEDVYKKIYGNIPKLVNIDTYDYNDYLNYKYDRYEKVYFAENDVKTLVLNFDSVKFSEDL
jgi:hypothetical protein